MKPKTIKSAAIVAVIAVASYWYWSPYLAVRQMQSAAQTRDADAFNDRVDYPKLRESLKGQFSAMVSEKMGNAEDSGNPFAALGTMLGMAMVNQFVDAMVRPEVMMRAMQDGKLSPKANPADDAASSAGSQGNQTNSSNKERHRKWSYERKGTDMLIAYAIDPEKPDQANKEKLGVVFQRSGFANWKLTELRLPTPNR